jgi:hypothetical protein
MKVSSITTNSDLTDTDVVAPTKSIGDEYDRLQARKRKGKKGDDKKDEKKKRDVECFNCHKKGHMKAECWAKGGGNEGGGPKSKKNKKDKDSA